MQIPFSVPAMQRFVFGNSAFGSVLQIAQMALIPIHGGRIVVRDLMMSLCCSMTLLIHLTPPGPASRVSRPFISPGCGVFTSVIGCFSGGPRGVGGRGGDVCACSPGGMLRRSRFCPVLMHSIMLFHYDDSSH